MDGLIAQAKTQLWNVVNEFVRAKKNGKPPAMQVALFEYGKSALSPERGLCALDSSARPTILTAYQKSCLRSRPTAARNTAAW